MNRAATARDVPGGNYRFLPGIAPFSSGVVALPGYQVVHVTLRAPIPWRDGFALIDRHLRPEGRPRAALCAIELRSPTPFSFEGFERVLEENLDVWAVKAFEDQIQSFVDHADRSGHEH